MQTYQIVENGKAIRCEICGLTSWNHNDIKHRYCGFCKRFHDDPVETKVDMKMGRVLELRYCTPQRPMPKEDSDNFYWKHTHIKQLGKFFNLTQYQCENCGWIFANWPASTPRAQ
jgi:rubredoxin